MNCDYQDKQEQEIKEHLANSMADIEAEARKLKEEDRGSYILRALLEEAHKKKRSITHQY